MLELSLFTGAGGGLLGTKLLGWTCVGAVEYERDCVKVLAQRQREGFLDPFPIWYMDVREFNARVAGRYAGLVDVVSAGFPCQPFSVAGKQGASDSPQSWISGLEPSLENDPRNMWPETIECIRRVRPRFVFLENVPGLLGKHGYFGRILRDLAEGGYDVRWRCLSAVELGAPHKRERLWVVANATCRGAETGEQRGQCYGVKQGCGNVPDTSGVQFSGESCAGVDVVGCEGSGVVSDSDEGGGDPGSDGERREAGSVVGGGGSGSALADADGDGCGGILREAGQGSDGPELGADVDGEGVGVGGSGPSCESAGGNVSESGGERSQSEQQAGAAAGAVDRSGKGRDSGWWAVEPSVGRVVDGLAGRVGQLRALGNGQVPAVVAAAWELLTAEIQE